MATEPENPTLYDLNAPQAHHHLALQLALTTVLIICAIVIAVYVLTA